MLARLCRLVLTCGAIAACSSDPTSPSTPPDSTPPLPPATDTAPTPRREFRGLWVATVANIDWPSRAGLTAAQQQAELVSILDRAASARLNAVVFHVRPAADALYASALEPWARYLTGTQGQAPGYDPLTFAVDEAHKRGLELHAWFNPFRAGNRGDTLRFAPTHVWNARRDLARVYGSQVWMDPGLPEVHDRTLAVIQDVVRRYDVDAVHLDDYFYPYLERDAQNRLLDFPDSLAYARHNPRGLTKADWRRDNVNRFVERLYGEVHAVKPWVRVGISPFGIWRPGNPAGITGLDAYAEIYADSRLWLNRGWVDYFAPQLYWSLASTGQSYTALLTWWAGQNTLRRHLWPGNAAYRVHEGPAPFAVAELPNQVTATRASATTLGGATGNIFYNTRSTLTANGGEVAAALAAAVYQERAVPPPTPWLDAAPPAAPSVAVTEAAPRPNARVWAVQLTPAPGEAPRWWVVQRRAGGAWGATTLLWGAARSAEVEVSTSLGGGRLEAVSVRAADAVWNLSPAAVWRAPTSLAAR